MFVEFTVGRRTVTAEVTVTQTHQTPPPAPCAWAESGDMSDLLQACWDVRDARSLSSLFFLYVQPHSTVASCPAPVTSSRPFPQDPCLPLPPSRLLSLLSLQRTLQRGRGSRRGDTFLPALPRLIRAGERNTVLQPESLGLAAPAEDFLFGTG